MAAEFNLKDLEEIRDKKQVMELLIKEGIIKEKKILKQLKDEQEMNLLQHELVRLQSHILVEGKRLLVIFEGRDAAGKGGAISRTTMFLNGKNYHIVALSKPTPKEAGQWYFQRYLQHLPSAGEMVFFDRSWYNRAVVEPVFGFSTPAQYQSFMLQVPNLEQLLIEDGINLIKIFLDISKKEQAKRLEKRKTDPLKNWKLGDLDKQAQEKWDDYSYYISEMIEKTATEKSPWVVISTDDKPTARLEVIKYILNAVPGFKTLTEFKNDKDIVSVKK
ncbi:polyphosphate kinase 2 [Ornithobacterium rhinotracheale]|uniref:polyphosphate kinase 2 n=1 Tax=Ornithobacterium rhinotracheale TaxID=28251 RepID=UPI00215980F1|nr:polyphosphate kinase 2 [Ornithobacterium rhinotracheale]UVD86368.1 polyphosphate kinase 2 [Ornithobacterium rhinotracheale]